MFAFIRAINTGTRRLTNQQVIAPFVAAGLGEPAAYQAAGNVAFLSDEEPADLEVRLESVLADAYGFEAPTFVRSVDEIRQVTDHVPFTEDELAATEGRVQVAFLRSEPGPDVRAAVGGLTPPDELAAFHARHWLWLPAAGISTSTMPVGEVERALGPMTIRTLGTIERMLAKFPV